MRQSAGIFCVVMVSSCLLVPTLGFAATEQAKQTAIDNGLAWLATQQQADGKWLYYNSPDGHVAATASAALAFIEEGHYPGSGTAYEAQVNSALTYLFDKTGQYNGGGGTAPAGSVYFRAENNADNRSIYTTGVCTPVIFALGQKLGKDTTIGGPSYVGSMTYSQAMKGIMDFYTWGQNADGGWRYRPNNSVSDNSTAQWGALPFLYGETWGYATPQSVKNGLSQWINTVQHPMDGSWQAGGSGYDNQTRYVNMAKTGGLMLELAVTDAPLSDARVQNALAYMTSMVNFDHWNESFPGANGQQWNGGHMDNPYAMWAVFKALEVYGMLGTNDNGTADPADDFKIGMGISSAPGGFSIGQDWGPQTSLAGDWYSQYCDLLVQLQNADGSWNGNSPWQGALAAGWYINILNASGAPEPVTVIPEPITVLGLTLGLGAMGAYIRRRRVA